jgi:hypothetical protein
MIINAMYNVPAGSPFLRGAKKLDFWQTLRLDLIDPAENWVPQ